MTSESKLEGGCLCGEIRYRIVGAAFDSDYCHCRKFLERKKNKYMY